MRGGRCQDLSEQQSSPKSRPYEMRRRAEQVGQTRQRIVEATVGLHGSVGPAATTIAAIADLAQVTRLTVYRHFPDETALFNACSAHWLSQQQPPEPSAWAQITDPAERLRAGLADLYRFYRVGAGMLAHIYRDFAVLPEAHQQRIKAQAGQYRDLLTAPFAGDPSQRRVIGAVIGHAALFWTWHSLCVEHGLADDEAVEVMTSAVLSAAPHGAPTQAPPPNPADAAIPSRLPGQEAEDDADRSVEPAVAGASRIRIAHRTSARSSSSTWRRCVWPLRALRDMASKLPRPTSSKSGGRGRGGPAGCGCPF